VFKIGDKVRVKDDADLDSVYLDRTFFVSPSGVIESVRCFDEDIVCKVYFEDIGSSWAFTSDMLELDDESLDDTMTEMYNSLSTAMKEVAMYMDDEPLFKDGDKVKVVSLKRGGVWYRNNLGDVYTIKGCRKDRPPIIGNHYNIYEEGALVLFEEDLELVDTLEQTIIFSPTQVRLAAECLSEYNHYLNKTPEYFEAKILNYIKDHAGTENTFVATAGFYVLFSDDDKVTYVDVLVDPAVGMGGDYVQATLKDDKLVVEF